ncbi:MAG: hypothetical protein KDD40_05900 [Bdellovibrionales bacterium]|nr:hypothetical protein [Bdellovibrionales bacterium]
MKPIFSLILLLFYVTSDIAQSKDSKIYNHKNEISVGISDLPTTLIPSEIAFMEHFLLLQIFQQTLIRIDKSGRIVSDLATSWQISPDGKTITFNINSNAKFHNGNSVNSRDVAYSLSQHVWPSSKSVVSNYLKEHLVGADKVSEKQFIKGIKEISSKKLQIHLKKPYPPFMYILTMPSFTIIPENSNRDNLIGSGPYKIITKTKEKIIFL